MPCRCIGFIGKSRTGKSTMQREYALKFKKRGYKIYAFDPQKNFADLADSLIWEKSDFKKIYELTDPKGLKPESKRLKNFVLILDDIKQINNENVLEPYLYKLVMQMNYYNMHIMFAAHSIARVIKQLKEFTTDYLIFIQDSSPADIIDRVYNHQEYLSAVLSLKELEEKYQTRIFERKGTMIFPSKFVKNRKFDVLFPHYHLSAEYGTLKPNFDFKKIKTL